jgi:MtN3 and saliva related transmembrane protein
VLEKQRHMPSKGSSGLWEFFLLHSQLMTTIQLLGMTAGSISAITFLPQVIKTWKTKSADDISLLMFTFATISVVMWLIYGIILKDIPIIYTNSLVLICSVIMLYFKFRFSSKKDNELKKVNELISHED